jgi:hypothetical protein
MFDIETKEMDAYLSNKRLEDLLIEEEIAKQLELQKRIDDVSLAYMTAYGSPYIPHFIINAIPISSPHLMSPIII